MLKLYELTISRRITEKTACHSATMKFSHTRGQDSHSNFYSNQDVTRVLRFFFPLSSFLSSISSRPTILRPRHASSCSYIVAAARLVNIITLGFYFHDFFYVQPRIPTTAARYRCCLLRPRDLFSVKRYKVIRKYEFGRSFHHSCSRFVVTHLPDTHSTAQYIAMKTIQTSI